MFSMGCNKKIIHKSCTGAAFNGVDLIDIHKLENFFEVNINVYELCSLGTITNLYHSSADYGTTMNLNLYSNHFSYITDINYFCGRHQCRKCNRLFKKTRSVKIHLKHCSMVTKMMYKGGFFSTSKSIFQELEQFGFLTDIKDKFYPHFIVFDFESILKKVQQKVSDKIMIIQSHRPISVSACSNVDGYDKAICFVNSDINDLLKDMINHKLEISKRANENRRKKWKYIFDQIESKMKHFEVKHRKVEKNDDSIELNFSTDEEISPQFLARLTKPNVYRTFMEQLSTNDNFEVEYNEHSDLDSEVKTESTEEEDETERQNERLKFKKTVYKKLEVLKEKFERCCSSVPVLGFNSSKYDLNPIKSKLPKILKLHLKESKPQIIKKNNAYLKIETENFRFLDVSHYLAPGTSYAQFLKAYNVAENKGFMCYDYLTDFEKLSEDRLPPYEAFYSNLKKRKCFQE